MSREDEDSGRFGDRHGFGEYRRLLISEIERLDRNWVKMTEVAEQIRIDLTRIHGVLDQQMELMRKLEAAIESMRKTEREFTTRLAKLETESTLTRWKLGLIGAAGGILASAIWSIVMKYILKIGD